MNLSFYESSDVECWFWTPDEFAPDDGNGLLVVGFSGTAGNSGQYSGGDDFMTAMVGAGRTLWNPQYLVLDFSKLTYSWGDNMTGVIGAARALNLLGVWEDEEIPLAIVVSEMCREGLATLIDNEMSLSPRDYFVESVESGIELVKSRK